MQNKTRQDLDAYIARQAQLNGVKDGTKQFVVSPSVEQTLEDKIRESAGFLGQINIYGVRDKSGEKIGLDVGSTIAGRTDTTGADRTTSDPSTLGSNLYNCEQTNFDTHVKYAKLDAWAKFPDFQTRMRNAVTRQQARDRIMIGFNGTSVAATTNRGANPLLQDVNIGWLEHLRVNNAANVLTGKKIGIGNGSDYENIDAAVFDATNSLIAEWYRDDPDLVVIMGRDLLTDKYLGLINSNDAPTERNALDTIISNKQVGGLRSVRVPFFPANAFAVTRLDNLSIYYQEGSRRRSIVDNAKRDQIEDYQSVNEAYVVEDYEMMAMFEGVLSWNGAAWA